MAINKTKKPNYKKVKEKFLTPDQIRQSLWDHGWRNDTQSPVSTAPYWAITAGIIPADAEPISGFFANSYANAMIQRIYTFICTTKYVYCIMQTNEVITYKILKYEDFAEINLYQDQYLSWQIYADIYLTKFRFFKLETHDPTSVLSFKKTVLDQQKARGFKPNVKKENKITRAGMSVWRFFWTKIRYVLNMKTDAKIKREIKKQRRIEKLKQEEISMQNSETQKPIEEKD